MSEAEWREIRELLAHRTAHPDPALAQAALGWARQQTRSRFLPRERISVDDIAARQKRTDDEDHE